MAKSFADLPLLETIQAAIREEGYTTPTPIQSAAIPPLLEGRDLLGCAQTGTGKTAAFAIPILQHLASNPQKATPRYPRALVLAPTRELAVQITESFATYGKGLKLRFTSVFGGVGQSAQVKAMTHGVHVLVATPGRLLDLMEQGHIHLDRLTHFVLDEADRMLDMGFMPSLKRIVRALPRDRQSIFLSATMPPPIEELASQLLHEHVSVMVTPPATTAQRVTQRVMFVDRDDKRQLLESLLEDDSFSKVLVFTRTKHGADRLAKILRYSGYSIDAIHGNKSQGARQRVLGELKNGKLRVLVATDVAARGIDVDGISHVINYEIPTDPESYVHRIGRTARAGEAGESISFCDVEEVPSLRDIEKEIGQSIPIDRMHPYHSDVAEGGSARGPKKPRQRPPRGSTGRTSQKTAAKAPRVGDSRGVKKVANSVSSEAAPQEVRRKRSISGKVRKAKPDNRKSYGFAHASTKSKGKKRPTR